MLDSVIFIDHLNGVPAASEALTAWSTPTASLITWIEVMVGATNDEERAHVEDAFKGVEVVPVGAAIARFAVPIRQERRLRLPDALILATARWYSCPLITRNTRDFGDQPDIRVPYRL